MLTGLPAQDVSFKTLLQNLRKEQIPKLPNPPFSPQKLHITAYIQVRPLINAYNGWGGLFSRNEHFLWIFMAPSRI